MGGDCRPHGIRLPRHVGDGVRVDWVRYRVPVALFIAALILRLSWVLLSGANALASSDDAKAYHDLAVNLVQRHQFVTAKDPPHSLDVPYATRPPLTPFALALVYLVFGPHLLAGQVLLALIGALAVTALYFLGRQLFSEAVGMLAGVLAAVYPFFVFLSALPLTENLAILLYTLLALLLTRGSKHLTIKHAALVGGLLGLAALNRPQILGFLPFLALLVVLDKQRSWRDRIKWMAVATACSAATLTPWLIRNHRVVGGWFPVSLQGGAVLYQGNNPYSQTALTKLSNGARGWYNDPRLGSDLAGLTPLETDRQAFHLAVDFMRQHPSQTFLYSVQKVGIFFRAYDNLVARASWYPLLVLGLVGFFWTLKHWRRLLPVYVLIFQTLLTAAIYTSMPRFRAPVEPFFLLFAAYGLHRIWKRAEAPLPRMARSDS